ncbi:hypothetical protein ABPG75_004451 [Micractinium tetrahymenae]
MASPTASPARTASGGPEAALLRAEAEPWQPARQESPVKPIRTGSRQRSDVLAQLDQIPFTPSQGVCTPSPTNMAAMWVPHPFFQQQQAWASMSGYGSPGHSSGGSDSSMLHSGSQPGTPGGGMYGGHMMWSSFCQPLPYSPMALQIAAASGALGSDPSTPARGRPGSAGASAAAAPIFMPGSPVMLSPGQMMFAQYFGSGGASRSSKQRSQSPPDSKDSASGSGDEGESDGMSSHGSGQLEVSDAARQIASAMCAAQQLPGEPPQQLLELASLLHAYGLVSAVPAFAPAPAAPSGAPLSPDSRRQQHRQRQKSAPKLNPDGSVRLNARQRRTLRRAQERAMKALLEAQTKAHGITSEQAASNLASMGVASMLLGSPPPATAPLHSPLGVPMPPAYMAPPAVPMAMSPGPPMLGGSVLHHDYSMALHMQQQAAAVAMMQQGVGGFDAYSMAPADMGAPIPLPMQPLHGGLAAALQSTPPPRGAGSRAGPVGYRTPGGYRGTPGGGRLSRFAPSDGVAAF